MLTDSISSPTVWLWLAATLIAVLLLAGTTGRRRMGLVEALRTYVKRSQDTPVKKTTASQDGNDSEPAS